jgi:ferrochelatase
MSIGIILLNLGGPDSLQAVRPFLYNLFSDRQIIRLGPPFMQRPLAWLISEIRSGKTKKMYSLIGGKSPIADITKAQAKALEELLNKQAGCPTLTKDVNQGGGLSFRVYAGMRYWHPFIEDVIPEMHKNGIRKIVALSLYPQYSVATSGSSIAKFSKVAAEYEIETYCIASWHNHSLYIDALVDVINKGLGSFSRGTNSAADIHFLFSAHGLPQKIIDEGDPYVRQTMETIDEITRRIKIKKHLSYQSRSGPVKWLSHLLKKNSGKSPGKV